MTNNNHPLEKKAHFLVDNRLIHTFRLLFKNMKHLPEEMAYNTESLILFQFFENLILFDKIVINSTIFGPIFEENRAFLNERFKKFINPGEVFVFEDFSQKLVKSCNQSIEITFGHFKLIKSFDVLNGLYDEIDSAHITGIKDSYEFVKKSHNKNKDYIYEQIREAKKFYGKNFFLAIFRTDETCETFRKIERENRDNFLLILTCMFVYFSFYLNSCLARLVGGDYSPIFSREKFVKKINETIDLDIPPNFKEMVDREFKTFYKSVKKTSGIGDSEPIHMQIGMINKQIETPLFGLAVYYGAKSKTLDFLLQEAVSIRQAEITQQYRKWLHGIRFKKGVLQSRKAELDEIIDALSRKYGLMRSKSLSMYIIDWFNPMSILKLLVGELETLRTRKKPQVIFLSNISDRLFSYYH